jgi:hypothetical protein
MGKEKGIDCHVAYDCRVSKVLKEKRVRKVKLETLDLG